MTSIIVHGGAGDFGVGDDPAPCLEGCLRAARLGHQVLARRGGALDAVVAAVTALEDDPTFNAGLGSALNLRGEVEADASVMRGEDGGAGAVGCLRDVKNPVQLARLVMERTPHVLLVAEGAREFAIEQGVALLAPGALVTERSRLKWQRLLEERTPEGHGTVGAVARDAAGHVAAATSTGGRMLKRPGRVGDTSLIGCGTFADDARGACSCTGLGEAIIKATLARQAVDLLGTREPNRVATEVVEHLKRFGGDGGLIVVDAQGRIGFAFNSQRMARAWVDGEGREGSGFGRKGGG
jgi:L-asparaginase / beta-aspartyl-peptidase